jgi:hypothetical protein
MASEANLDRYNRAFNERRWRACAGPERALRFEERFLRFFGPRLTVELAAVRTPEELVRAAAPLDGAVIALRRTSAAA